MQLRDLKGLGPKTEKLLNKLSVYTLSDLLYYFPRSYERFEAPKAIAELREGELGCISAVVDSEASLLRFQGKLLLSVRVRDESGALKLSWFNAAFLKNTLRRGQRLCFRGKLVRTRSGLGMTQPRIFSESEYARKQRHLEPLYSLTAGLSNQSLMKLIAQALELPQPWTDFLPPALLYNRELMPLKQAVHTLHLPEDTDAYRTARQRFAYSEMLLFSLAMLRQKQTAEEKPPCTPGPGRWAEQLRASLPFQLTEGQDSAVADIRADLGSGRVMNRLLQGDVGSGKTLVALLAMLDVCEAGCQAAMMAPTEILARQHRQSLQRMLDEAGIPLRVGLLVSACGAAERRAVQAGAADGSLQILVGTHALIQDSLNFAALGLVITDEQHRFGVRQRRVFSDKGERPHVLVMSATPIPRTLAMLLYADMQVSRIHGLPAKRLPIKTCAVDLSYRPRAYRFIEGELEKGRQAYVICPMVDESEQLALENVCDYAEKLRASFPGRRIDILHGRMKAAQKEAVMLDFQAGKTDILVSTTVVEVGVDVPNASVILIENAERFGLAQLHQLRGRVGRGSEQSYCILVDSRQTEHSRKRMEILCASTDGFYLANEDLKLRGPGELFGLRQSGELNFEFADVYEDEKLLEAAHEDARYLLSRDPELSLAEHELLAQKLEAYTEPSRVM